MDDQDNSPKPFYKDRNDTLEDAGITSKQLRTWREAGLFKAELGPSTRKFTQTDVANLKILKQFIVELGLPIHSVQRMLEDLPYTTPMGFTYLNIKTGKLVRPQSALTELMNLYAGFSSLDKLESWLLTLALRCFEQIKSAYPSPKVYEAKREELLERVRRMDLAARAEDPEDAYDEDKDGKPVGRAPQFWPGTAGDPEPTLALMNQLVNDRGKRLSGVHRAKARAWQEEIEWF